MKQTLEYLQALAEAVAPLATEISAGLLERPVPAFESKNSVLQSVCHEVHSLMESGIPAINDALAELALCEEEDIEDIIEEIAEPTLDFVDMARKIWKTSFSPEEEKARPYLAALAESPAVQVLALLQRIMHAAIDPWALFDNPDAPDLDLGKPLNCKRESEQLKALQKKYPEWDFSKLIL